MPAKPFVKRLAGWVFEAIVLLALVYLIHLWQTRHTVAGMAPALSGSLLGGGEFGLVQQRGRPVLVHFWATWCPVCRLEAGNIERLVDDYPVITIAMRSGSPAAVHAYLKENDLNFSVISDPDGRLAADWGVSAVPTTFMLDAQGQIRFVEVGYTTSLGLRLRMAWLD